MFTDLLSRLRSSVDMHRITGDPMFADNEEHYASVGASAMNVIFATQLLAEAPPPRAILDFACATGRVTRWLRAAYPTAELHVADINPDWMAWSAERFGATGFLSNPDLSVVHPPRQYDLIWCGSLATHLPETEAKRLVARLHGWLCPSGIAVVTAHGRRFVENLTAGTVPYFPDRDSAALMMSNLALNEFGYVPYPGQNYGISANTLQWLIRAAREQGARIVSVSEHVWDGHQDVLSFQNTGR